MALSRPVRGLWSGLWLGFMVTMRGSWSVSLLRFMVRVGGMVRVMVRVYG